MAPRPSHLTIAALLVLPVLGACAQTDPSVSPSDPPASAASPTATELTATDEALPAGRYTRAGFEPAITFELDGSWQAVQLFGGFFDVQQDVGTPDVIAVQFARPSAIFGEAGTDPATTAEAAIASVQANSALAVIESSDSRIGGLDGSQVTVENSGDAHATVMQVPPGPLGIDPGRRLWIAFFDTPDGLLAIMVGGSVAQWEEALAAAEPVLESVQIGP